MNVRTFFKARREVWLLLVIFMLLLACVWPWMQMKKTALQQQAVQQQWMQIQVLAAQAQQLRSRMAPSGSASVTPLATLVAATLGDSVRFDMAGDRGMLTLQKVPGAVWASGLETLRQTAGVRVVGAQLDIHQQGVSGTVELRWVEQ